MRVALGASPLRILRQVLAENVLLGAMGAIVGLLVAFWGVSWLVANAPAGVPRIGQSRIDAFALLFASGAALLASLIFGVAPAFRSARVQMGEAFQESAARVTASRDWLRSALAVGEVGLALMLLVGAGLLIRSALLRLRVNPGFDLTNLVVGRVGLPDAGYHDPAVARQTLERMLAAIQALPGVEAAAVVSRAPLAGGAGSNGLLAEGKPLDPSNLVDSELRVVSPDYLATARVPLKMGRTFTPQDTREKTMVALVNETLAWTMWPGANPIGKRFACCEHGPKGRLDPVWHEVVGVVGDVRAWGLDRQFKPEFYMPLPQIPPEAWDWIGRTVDFVVRTRGDAIPLPEMRFAVASVAPGCADLRRFDHAAENLEQPGAIAFRHLPADSVRRHRAAARMRRRLRRSVLHGGPADARDRHSHGAWRNPRTCDLWSSRARHQAGRDRACRRSRRRVTGIPNAGQLALRGTADGRVTLLVVSLILAAVALIASYLPARRASLVDPMVALGYE